MPKWFHTKIYIFSLKYLHLNLYQSKQITSFLFPIALTILNNFTSLWVFIYVSVSIVPTNLLSNYPHGSVHTLCIFCKWTFVSFVSEFSICDKCIYVLKVPAGHCTVFGHWNCLGYWQLLGIKQQHRQKQVWFRFSYIDNNTHKSLGQVWELV